MVLVSGFYIIQIQIVISIVKVESFLVLVPIKVKLSNSGS